jgi:hypothetical protein
MDKFEEAKQYRDKFGMNQLTHTNGVGDVSQNGALFTLEYLIWLINDEDIPEDVKRAEIERLREVYKSLETFPGVSSRVPGGDEFDSMDNTGAIAAFSGLFDQGGYSKRAWEHGDRTHSTAIDMVQDPERNTKFYTIARIVTVMHCLNPVAMFRWIKSGFTPKMFWNNNRPTEFCLFGWHGRSPGHMAFLKMSAGKFVGPFGLLSILVGQFLGCFTNKGNTDARKLPYCNWQFLKNRNFIWKLFYRLWCYILMKQYPNGMRDVYSIYYQDPEHFLRKYSKPYVK